MKGEDTVCLRAVTAGISYCSELLVVTGGCGQLLRVLLLYCIVKGFEHAYLVNGLL